MKDYTDAINQADKPPGGLAAFDAAQAAPEFAPIPPGVYAARVVRGEYCTTRAGAEAYRVRFEVLEGEQAGRTVQRTWTFSDKALAYTKRDLAPLGLTTQAHLLSPFPSAGVVITVRVVVALQRGDDGIERNDIKRIEVLRIDRAPASRFVIGENEEAE